MTSPLQTPVAATLDWPVYPGHPLVLATIIMSTFRSFDEASRPTLHGWCEALADNRIPGAGDHVGAAMSVLTSGANGASLDDMVASAENYWRRGQAGGHVSNVEAGSAQATAIEPRFRELAQKWLPSTAAATAGLDANRVAG